MVSWRILKLTSTYQALLLALVVPVTWLLWPKGALAALLGGLFSTANFLALKALVRKTFSNDKAKLAYTVLLGFKMVLALGVMTVLLVGLKLHPAGFALGLATMLVGFGAALVHVLNRPQTAGR